MGTPSVSKVKSVSFRERQTPTPDCTGQQQKKSVSFRSPPQSTPQSQNQHQIALGSGNKATNIKQSPEMKVRQIPVLDLSASHSNPANSASSGHSTDAITIHTPPVISSRAARSKVPSDSSGGANKTGGLSSPRNSKLAKDSPRLKKITPRGSDQQESGNSSKATPRRIDSSAQSESALSSSSSSSTSREVDQKKASSPRGNRSRALQKKVSRKFNDFKINLAGLPEKIVPSFSTSLVSPSSSGGVSPGKTTPIKKQNNLLKDIPVDIRNQLAKAYTALKKDPQFIGSGETRRTMMLNAKMIGILSEKNIAFDTKKLQALAADAALRSQYAEISLEIDFSKNPYPDLLREGSKKFLNSWNLDKSDKGQKFRDLPDDQRERIDQHFMPTFIADYYRAGVSHERQMPDGSAKPFASPLDLAEYLNQDADGESRSRYISNVASQNIVNLLQQLSCGGLPGTTSPIKLFDGTPLIPRGRVEQRFIYQREKDGSVVVQVNITIHANNLGNASRQSQMQNERRNPVAIDDDAKLQIDTTLRFESTGEWTIYNPHLVASGWNLPADY